MSERVTNTKPEKEDHGTLSADNARVLTKVILENGEYIEDPTWDQVHQALLEMDGDILDQVVLQIEGIGSVFAGGGNDERYIVIAFSDTKDESLTLADLSETGPDVWLKIQTHDPKPAKWCVRLPLVLKVFKQFFDTAELPTDVRWEIDSLDIEADFSSVKSYFTQEERASHLKHTRLRRSLRKPRA